MSVNSSSTSTTQCTNGTVTLYMYFAIAAVRILLLLPLSTFILYLGHQRWRQQRSSKTMTHSDIFTYHVAAMQLIGVLGIVCLFGGTITKHSVMTQVGQYTFAVPLSGEVLFQVLTCVERYLAVVHPITYRGLRNARGVRIRNICIGCVWLLSFGINVAAIIYPHAISVLLLVLLVFFIIIMCFCSLSVLCALIRPGPGDGGGEKERVDQSKQRAFYTITVITCAVWLWFVGILVSTTVDLSPQLNKSVRCLVTMSVHWLNLPSTLVSPLLYLHRAGKLPCCCRNNE